MLQQAKAAAHNTFTVDATAMNGSRSSNKKEELHA